MAEENEQPTIEQQLATAQAEIASLKADAAREADRTKAAVDAAVAPVEAQRLALKAELDVKNPALDAANALIVKLNTMINGFVAQTDTLGGLLQDEATAAFSDARQAKWTDQDKQRVAARQKALGLAVTNVFFALSGLKSA